MCKGGNAQPVFGDDTSPVDDIAEQKRVVARICRPDPGAEHCHGKSTSVKTPLMGSGIDPHGKSAHDRDPGIREPMTELFRNELPVRG